MGKLNKKIILIFFIALTVRILFLFLAPPRPMDIDDSGSWDAVGWNLRQGKGFTEKSGTPTSVRPPLFPVLLAGVYFFFGHNYFLVKIVQAALGALTCGIIFLFANLVFDKKIGFLSGLACAFYPPLVVYTGIIGSENTFTFLLAVFVYFLTKAFLSGSFKDYLYSGIVLGLLNLCRSTLILYPFFFLSGLLLIKKKKKQIYSFVFATVISFLMVLPWTIRNYRVFGGFLLVNTSAGELFWMGTLKETDGRALDYNDPKYRVYDYPTHPIQRERFFFREGVKNILSEPLLFIKLSFKKFLRLWFQPVGQVLTAKKFPIIGFLLYPLHGLLIFFALLGIINNFKKLTIFLPVFILFIYFTIMHSLIPPIPRYRLPIEPFFIIFVLVGVKDLFHTFAKVQDLPY